MPRDCYSKPPTRVSVYTNTSNTLTNNNTDEGKTYMYENAHIQTVAVDFSRGREQETSISRTLNRLNTYV